MELREYGLSLLERILKALHEKRFADAAGLADETAMDPADLEEFVQGTAELNGFYVLDEFREENLCYMDEEGDVPFLLETYLTADGGNDLPLVLRLKLERRADGSVKSAMEIEPN